MPIQREHVQFAVLFLSVPIQYLVVQHMGSSEVTRTYAISKMVDQLSNFQQSWLSIEPWKEWCKRILLTSADAVNKDDPLSDEDNGESPAVEVLRFRESEGYFGQSPAVRDPKPPQVKYRVGQVVRHKIWGYRGVIISWDETAKAPEKWIKDMHGDKLEWRKQPNYSVLVDTRDRRIPQMTYVPEENIEVINNRKVLHPSVDAYFEAFDGSQYLPRPWLRTLFPRD